MELKKKNKQVEQLVNPVSCQSFGECFTGITVKA